MTDIVLLDTNLLILAILGETSPTYIAKHKRANQFSKTNYADLRDLIVACEMTTIPHVLAETSNLLAQGPSGRMRAETFETFKQFVLKFEERQIASKDGVQSSIFNSLGLTDAILLQVAASGATLVTVDKRLFAEVIGRGFKAINFLEFIEAE